MSGDGLFHIDQTGQLVAMRVAPYEAEDVLQALLASHPDLLAGGQMTPDEPRRWLLVRREYGVPDRAEAADRWSLDHLFVDQDSVPTLVEVKRSSDTRIRREVVGQMLDYAANGVRYWPAEDLRVCFEQTQRELGQDPAAAVARLCADPELTVEAFFARVADNLRAGRIRMVFVADVIPDELRRIVEFLNEQMDPAEVFAVEVKQYLAEGYPGQTLVPAVYGRTAAASRKTTTKATSQPIEPELLRAKVDEEFRALWDRLERWADKRGLALEVLDTGVRILGRDGFRTAQLYPAAFRGLMFNLDPVRQRGHEALADSCLEVLRTLTAKTLTAPYPNLPIFDALAHWDAVQGLLDRLSDV